MADQVFTSSFVADTEGFTTPILTAAQAMAFAEASAVKLASATNKFGREGEVVAQTFKFLTDTMNDLVISQSKSEQGWQINSASLSKNAEKSRELAAAQRELASELDATFRASEATEKSFRALIRAENAAETKAATAAQKDLSRELNAAFQASESTERSFRALIKAENAADARTAAQAQRELTNELRAAERAGSAFEKELRKVLELEAARANQAAAAAFGTQQLRQAQPSLAGATPSQSFQITGGIGTVQAQIAAGTVAAARATEIWNNALAGTPQLLNPVEQSIARAALATETFTKSTEETARTFNLGWQSIIRIAAIQLIHSAIYSLVNAMKDAAKQSIDFQIKISEIRTISQDTSLSFGDWAKAVRGLSDEFGRPLTDVAKAAYETVSNQIAKGAEATIFLEKALRFSQATVSTTAESVDLLSSAINAYQLTAADTDRVSAILFKTIDLGRVRASEMASTFGRVAVPASQLGVTLEETSAAIATLTINGVKASEAFTQLNTLFVAFLKPSEAMKKFFAEIGVNSGEAAIATFGFEGVIKKLGETTRGSSTELAALIRNARGLRGAIGLTSDFEGFQKNLQGITGAAQEFDKAVTIATESAGFKLQKELNKTHNTLINDFGIPLTEATVRVTEAFGGLSTVLEGSVRIAATLAASFALYKISSLAITSATNAQVASLARKAVAEVADFEGINLNTLATNQNTVALRAREAAHKAAIAAGLSQELALGAGTQAANNAARANYGIATSLKAIGLSALSLATSPLVLITGFIALYQYLRTKEEELSNLREKSIDQFKKINEERLRNFTFEQERERTIFESGVKDQFQSYLRLDADVLKLSKANADRRIANEKEVAEATKASLTVYLEDARKAISEEEKLRKEALSNIEKARKALADEERRSGNREFDRQLALTPESGKTALFAAREKTLEAEAAKLFAGAGDNQENLSEGIKKLSEAHEILNERFRRQIALRKEIEELTKRQKEIDDEAAARGDIQDAKSASRQLTEDNALFKARNKPQRAGFISSKSDADDATRQLALSEAQRKADFERQQIHEKLVKAQEEYGAVDLRPQAEELARFKAQEVELLKLQKKITDELEIIEQRRADRIKAQVDAEQLRVANLQQVFKDIAEFKLPTKDLTAASLDETLKKFDDLIARAKESGLSDQGTLFQLQKERAGLKGAGTAILTEQDVTDTGERLTKIRDFYIKTFNDVESRRKAILEGTTGQESTLFGNLKSISGALQEDNRTSIAFSTESFDKFIDKIKQSGAQLEDLKKFQALQKEVESVAPGLLDKKFADGRTLGADFAAAATSLNKLLALSGESAAANNALTILKEEAAKTGINLNKVKESIQLAQDAGNIFGEQFLKQLRDLSAETLKLRSHLGDLKGSLSLPSLPGGQAQGHALGGFGSPRGVDVIPAWLRPGEMVMNPGAAQAFYPLLKQMNMRGQSPQYFANGGEVNFNGTEVNVISSGSATVDARELWTQFQRLARSGMISPMKG